MFERFNLYFYPFLCIFCIQFFWALETNAQGNSAFRQFKREQGLSQNSVIAIEQDQDGFIWVGTRKGLNKFDGYDFFKYDEITARQGQFRSNDVRVLYYSKSTNSLWVGAEDGLSELLIAKDSFVNYQIGDGRLPASTRFIYEDSKNAIWTFGKDHLYVKEVDQDTFSIVQISAQSQFSILSINGMLEESSDTYWMATNQGLFQVKKKEGVLVKIDLDARHQHLSTLEDIPVSTIVRDDAENLWVGSSQNGFYIWLSEGGSLLNYRDYSRSEFSPSANRVQCIKVDDEGNAWIGTGAGLKYFDQGKKEILDRLSDAKTSVRSILIDRKGSLWVGTYFDGLFYLDRDWGIFQHHKANADSYSLSYKVVGAMVEDPESNIWIATEGGGLNYFDARHSKVIKVVSEGLSSNNIKSLDLDNQHLWAGTFHRGLNRYNIRNGQITHYRFDPKDQNSIPHDNVYGLKKIGNLLWIATYGGGICYLDTDTETFRRFQQRFDDSTSLSSNLCRVLHKDQQDRLWIGTDDGLDLMVSKQDSFAFKHYLPHHKIMCIFQAPDGLLWIGTNSHGLVSIRIEDDFEVKEHLVNIDQTIYGILMDSGGKLWLSTDRGILRYDPLDGSSIKFSDAEGIENMEFNFNAHLQSSGGTFYFGGTDGLITFDPASLSTSQYVAPLVFSNLTEQGEIPTDSLDSRDAIQYIDHLTFDYDDASFTLKFALLDYADPIDNIYEYKLEGLDQDWIRTRGSPTVKYTIQREGEYYFCCKAASHQGIWNPAMKRLHITVLPPFYRSPGAYAIYLLLVLLASIMFYYFVRMRKRLYLEKMAMQQQKTLHESRLRLYTDIAHEFKNPLTLILSPIESLLKKHGHQSLIARELIYAQKNAMHLLHLINQLLSFRKAESDALKMEVRLTDLVTLTYKIFGTFEHQAQVQSISFECKSRSSQILAWIDRDKMAKVLSNLLSNAFKFTPDGGWINIELIENEETLEWRIRDSGPGIPELLRENIFNRFFTSIEGNEHEVIRPGTGIGLALCKKMTELHHGNIVCSDCDFGAEFRVEIPKGRGHFQESDFVGDEIFDINIPVRASVPRSNMPGVLEEGAGTELKRKQKILIIDDNRELLEYLSGLFGEYYCTITSTNGQDGIKMAEKHLPDLIISDIVMSKVNGLMLCQQLKGRVETSHIPIIMLTAKSSRSSIITGLNHGADDYIIKPFDPDELIIRVRNILESRKVLRERVAKTLKLEPEKLDLSSVDEEVINKAIRIIEAHIGDTNFSIEDFAREMNVSRQLLFTKIKTLTSMTPNNFLKMIRLKRAYQILQTTSFTVSEVARKVGFRDPRYFTKCFEKEYSILPSAVENDK